MARQIRTVTITAEGRDRGKAFVLNEMSADQGEWWAIRALSVLGNAGVDLPKNALEAGMSGLAHVEATSGAVKALFVVGLRMLPGVDIHALRPLLDEMNTCIQYQPPGGGPGGRFPAQAIISGPMCQIEEIKTFLQLRADLIELHLGFSLAGAVSTSQDAPPQAVPAF